MMSSELDLSSGTGWFIPVAGLCLGLRLKVHAKAPQATINSSWVSDMPRHWRWPHPNDVMPLMVGNCVRGAWKVGQPGSNQRSGRKLSGSGYFLGLRRNALKSH